MAEAARRVVAVVVPEGYLSPEAFAAHCGVEYVGFLPETTPRPIMVWRSTDTAPRDGTAFLAFTADFVHGARFNCCVQEARWSGKTSDDAGYFRSRNGQIVTHWMPLPAPPNS